MKKKRITWIIVGSLLSVSLFVVAYVVENLFAVVETAAVMSLKPIKHGVDPALLKEGIVYRDAESANEADVFAQPQGLSAPVALIFYGNYWQGGRKMHYHFLAGILHRLGLVVVIPDSPAAYGILGRTLLPEATVKKQMFPAQLTAGAAAVRWVKKNAAKYGGNPEKLFFVALNSGSQVAMLLAMNPESRRMAQLGSSLLGMVAIDTVADLTHEHDDFRRFVRQSFGDAPDLWKVYSPITYARNFKSPLLMLGAQYEPEHASKQAAALVNVLAHAGNQPQYQRIKARAVRSLVFKLGRRGDQATAIIEEFIRKHRGS